MFSVEVVTDSARLQSLAGQWNELWARSPRAGLFQTFEYCLDAWELVARPAGRDLACLAGWHDGRLVAVWPFVTFRHRLWTYARPLEASGVERHELLVDPTVDAAEWVQEAWRALAAQARVDAVDVSFCDDSPTASALAEPPTTATRMTDIVSGRTAASARNGRTLITTGEAARGRLSEPAAVRGSRPARKRTCASPPSGKRAGRCLNQTRARRDSNP